VSSAVGRWRSDWGRYFTTQIDAGAVHVLKITQDAEFWHPTGLALLAFSRREGDAEVAYRHTVRTDLFLGNTFLVDEVTARGSLPIDEDGDVVVEASGGRQKNRLIDLDGELATVVDVWLLDVGASWRVQSSLRVGLRYQHIEQESGAELPPLPLDFVRNTILAVASFEYPPDDRMPRAYRPPRRVDRDDDSLQDEVQQQPGRRR
jgi:hypothetical protein